MHIHPNSSQLLAPFDVGGQAAREIQTKRAAEVRRKLSTVSRSIEYSEESSGAAKRVEASSYEAEQQQGDDDGFGRLFSAKA